MKRPIKILAFLLVAFATFKGIAQTSDSVKMGSLMVYGDGFAFGVKEPDGWTGDIDLAKEYFANIVFYKSKADIKNGGALIQVYHFNKEDEDTEKDLAYDIKQYKDKYKNLKQEKFLVSHISYKCFAKLVFVEEEFYQYLVYVNPGPKYKGGASFAMNISKRPATEEELKAFKQIISSFIMMKG
ncbi:MAG: hypothetical protein JWO06_487 [Bacteroidota bacterium]|nr:hypothetical protein [Bacteroidota bacterium]